jgi:hypothetical protein
MKKSGIGQTKGSDDGIIRGKQIDIACNCQFAQNGRAIPNLIKFQDEYKEIHTVDHIEINSFEEKRYSGIPSIEYDCTIMFREVRYLVKIIYYKQVCKWAMVFLVP